MSGDPAERAAALWTELAGVPCRLPEPGGTTVVTSAASQRVAVRLGSERLGDQVSLACRLRQQVEWNSPATGPEAASSL